MRCNRMNVRSGSPGRMRNRKKFRTSTNRSVPAGLQQLPAYVARPAQALSSALPRLRKTTIPAMTAIATTPSPTYSSGDVPPPPPVCVARAEGLQVHVGLGRESEGHLAGVGVRRGLGPALELVRPPGFELVVVVEDDVRIILVGDPLHLLYGGGPLVEVELLLLLLVHPGVVLVAPERVGPAHDLVAGEHREDEVGIRVRAPAPDEHVVVCGVDGVGEGRVAHGLGLQPDPGLLEPVLDKLARVTESLSSERTNRRSSSSSPPLSTVPSPLVSSHPASSSSSLERSMSKPWISDSVQLQVVLGQGRRDQRGAGNALALQDLLGKLLLVDGPVDRLPHQRVQQRRVPGGRLGRVELLYRLRRGLVEVEAELGEPGVGGRVGLDSFLVLERLEEVDGDRLRCNRPRRS